jgi:hypothetical protein
MSQDEQDAILGRTVREYGELQRSLALIDAELETLADDAMRLAGFVNRRVRLSGHHPDAERPSSRRESPNTSISGNSGRS